VVAAPDRGFQGNEEVRELFEAFAATNRRAALLFVTDERTAADFASACATLGGAAPQLDEILVLPLFLSDAERRFRLLEKLVGERPCRGSEPSPGSRASVRLARPFGESYYAVELLGDRLRSVAHPAGRRVQIAGWGADPEHAVSLQADLQALAESASRGLAFSSVEARIVDLDDRQAPLDAADVVVPFAMASKLDGMMSFAASLRRRIPQGAELADADITPDPLIGLWLEREARLATFGGGRDLGVVVLAHGADYHWNETMRRAIEPLAASYLVEPVFSMADADLVERGIRRLEARGARAIVVVRVFGLESSFADSVEHMLGLDVEGAGSTASTGAAASGAGHAGHAGHGGHGSPAPRPRIRTALPVTTVGGLQDHPLFAQALLERARALSRDPARETVILTAHGSGDDATDRHWRGLLDSLAATMRAGGGEAFRAIVGGTWREDWPAQREAAVRELRGLVEQATRDGGRALVIPARTLGAGPEHRYLDGLAYELGQGFAPHPLFVRWLEAQVATGVERLRGGES
jgi:hypothetical protein